MKKQLYGLDDAQVSAEKLTSLLKDRQEGLISWNMMLAERMIQLRDILIYLTGGQN